MTRTTLDNIHTFADFRAYFEGAHSSLSIWGWRHVSVILQNGTVERLSIDSLAERVGVLAKEMNFEYTPQERAHGASVTCIINRLYNSSDILVENACLFTRVLSILRVLFSKSYCGFSMRFIFDNYYTHIFNYYTPRQYLETYLITPEEARARRQELYCYNNPTRYSNIHEINFQNPYDQLSEHIDAGNL